MSISTAELVVDVRRAATQIEMCRNRASLENLAGWEPRVIREAADTIERLEAKLAEAREVMAHISELRPSASLNVSSSPERQLLKARNMAAQWIGQEATNAPA